MYQEQSLEFQIFCNVYFVLKYSLFIPFLVERGPKFFCNCLKLMKYRTFYRSGNDAQMTPSSEKKTKNCEWCGDPYSLRSIKPHAEKCELYMKLTKNGTDCSVCSREYGSRKVLYSHIGNIHKDEVLEIAGKGE